LNFEWGQEELMELDESGQLRWEAEICARCFVNSRISANPISIQIPQSFTISRGLTMATFFMQLP